MKPKKKNQQHESNKALVGHAHIHNKKQIERYRASI